MARFRISGVSNLRSFSAKTTFAPTSKCNPPDSSTFAPILILPTAALRGGPVDWLQRRCVSESRPARIERARALAAVHQLQAAATELENIRASVNDVTLRNVTTLMLLGIYLEDGNYGRSQALLEETFRRARRRKTNRFALISPPRGRRSTAFVRTSLVIAVTVSIRAITICRWKPTLILTASARSARKSDRAGKRDRQRSRVDLTTRSRYRKTCSGIRLSLARNDDDRAKWQTEYLMAREKMASSNSGGVARSITGARCRYQQIPNPFATKPAAPEPAAQAAGQPDAHARLASTTGPEPQLISTGSLSGRETKRVTPAYPPMAKTHNVTGTVRVFAIIDENGKDLGDQLRRSDVASPAAEEAARAGLSRHHSSTANPFASPVISTSISNFSHRFCADNRIRLPDPRSSA
jgi:hypothetical protein